MVPIAMLRVETGVSLERHRRAKPLIFVPAYRMAVKVSPNVPVGFLARQEIAPAADPEHDGAFWDLQSRRDGQKTPGSARTLSPTDRRRAL